MRRKITDDNNYLGSRKGHCTLFYARCELKRRVLQFGITSLATYNQYIQTVILFIHLQKFSHEFICIK